MVDHIYGRQTVIDKPDRPHMLIRELELYVAYLQEELQKVSVNLSHRTLKYFETFRDNLNEGIHYYQSLGETFITEKKDQFLSDLANLKAELNSISFSIAEDPSATTA